MIVQFDTNTELRLEAETQDETLLLISIAEAVRDGGTVAVLDGFALEFDGDKRFARKGSAAKPKRRRKPPTPSTARQGTSV